MPKTATMRRLQSSFTKQYGARGKSVLYGAIMSGKLRGKGVETKRQLKAGIRRAARKRRKG